MFRDCVKSLKNHASGQQKSGIFLINAWVFVLHCVVSIFHCAGEEKEEGYYIDLFCVAVARLLLPLSPHLNLQSSLWIDIKKLELADIFPKDFFLHKRLFSQNAFSVFSSRLTRKIPRIPFCLLAFARSNFTL